MIVDEIHAVARTKRGVHLALSLERLEERRGRPLQRIGLSATQRPLDEVGRFLVGAGRECTVIDAGIRKPLDLKIHVPVESMREPDAHDVTDPAVGRHGHCRRAAATWSARALAAARRPRRRARSGRRSTPSCCGSSRSTAPPSSS